MRSALYIIFEYMFYINKNIYSFYVILCFYDHFMVQKQNILTKIIFQEKLFGFPLNYDKQ